MKHIPRNDGHELALHFGLDLLDGFSEFPESRETLDENGDEVFQVLFGIHLGVQGLQDDSLFRFRRGLDRRGFV